jgi:hypothetical protein
MTASRIHERPQSAQVEPSRKAAALKASNAAKARRERLKQQALTPPMETTLAPKPERVSKAHRSQGPPPEWLPDPLVAKRYSVNPRTLRRWDEDASLDFPPVILINGRRYRELAALEAWERRTAANARSAKAKQFHAAQSVPEAG